MPQSIIRYRTKPDRAAANAELVRAVYAELHPPGRHPLRHPQALGSVPAGRPRRLLRRVRPPLDRFIGIT